MNTEITLSRQLARLVRGLTLDDMPVAVRERALYLALDTIGCGLAARGEAFAARYAASVQALAGSAAGGAGRSVVGHAMRLPLRDAAMLNGVLMHGLDYDDTHMRGIIHLSVSVLPTVLAVGAQSGATGAEVLTAYIAGLEAGARIASATHGGLHAKGFHPTAVVGVFASTLAGGRLLGLDEDALVHAQGVALSLAAGSLQFIEDGAWTKRLHPGWAAQSAITAIEMARHGIVAPEAAYEGRYGFYTLYLGEGRAVNPADALEGLDAVGRPSTWELDQIAIKPFPMCHFVHASADAAIALQRDVDPARIRRVEVRVPAGVVPAVCEPLAAKRRPQTDYDAKFSLPYAVASGLLRGRLGLADLLPAALRDPQALALMDRIDYLVDPESTFPTHYTGEVRIELDDGRTVVHREAINRGHAERPLSNDDIEAKYRDNATLQFDIAVADLIRDAVLGLAHATDLRALEAALARDPAA